MCGIYGYFASRGQVSEPRELLERMAGALFHRGPDEAGLFRQGAVALGSRRLSIVDLVSGRQPLVSENGEVQLVCNGEIYNAPDLRRTLEARHTFRTRSDNEVLIHLYEDLGSEFLDPVEGMFALALWDARRSRLLVARDRAGEKPLFHAWHRGVFYFASELSALRCVEGLGGEVDAEALRLYLAFGYLRVVIGKRGPYVEFSRNQIIWENFLVPEHEKYRLTNAVVYYDEYRSKDPTFVKLYLQKRPVAYADYKVGLCYISPFDLLRDEMQPVII